MSPVQESTEPPAYHLSMSKTVSDLIGQLSLVRHELNELRNISHAVLNILQGLCKRDSRFSFIKSALDEFLNGPVGLNFRHEAASKNLGPAPTTQPYEFWNVSDIVAYMEAIGEAANPTTAHEDNKVDRLNFDATIYEIICSAIFELLNVFDIDITIEQASVTRITTAALVLLQSLYEKSKSLAPQAARETPSQLMYSEREKGGYQYQNALDPVTSQVRILEILRGVGEDPIECRLIVRNLYDDGIPEALSYVWGMDTSRESILVDQKPFSVRRNLYEILGHLRRADATRTIWVDAICINQSDAEEKAYQVRLMRDIYSNAKDTIIWLGDYQTTEISDVVNSPAEARASLPVGFGGITLDQYDLCAILEEYQKYPKDKLWDEKQWAIYVMLNRCVLHIQNHEWWERIWTVQEATLPSKSPIVFFRGRSFSFDNIITAERLLLEHREQTIKSRDNFDNWRNVLGHDTLLAIASMSRFRKLGTRVPLICRLRPGLENSPTPGVKSLAHILEVTDTYRASVPQDKIFALESLLPRCLGRLINVDYGDDRMTVFRRITARYYNKTTELFLVNFYKFLFESPSLPGETPGCPSWVLDFTYSDASRHKSTSARGMEDLVTLDGFLHRSRSDYHRIDGDMPDCFATPKTLFCTGRYIDRIRMTRSIPNVSDDEPLRDCKRLIMNIHRLRQSILGAEATSDAGLSAVPSLLQLFCMVDNEKDLKGDLNGLVKARNKELAGKTCFITGKGLVGISTARFEPGDSLALLHSAPVYLILKEVGDRNGNSSAAKVHRIVARAAIAEGLGASKTLIESSPSQRFQIV
ncbi:HET-domain-containing protein [Xylaria cf. heliscus]|nr:HET-domain-containing protein [Xylaria cf. heliscus]